MYSETIYFLDVRVDNFTLEQAIARVKNLIEEEPAGSQLFFTNVHSIHLARRDPELMQCINNADLVLPDGSGLKIAGHILGKPVLENLNGTDFTPEICERAQTNNWSVYLLGAHEEVVQKCRSNLQQQFPRLSIKGARNGYFSKKEEKQIIEDINEKRPDILLVALGSPLQEKWIAEHAPDLNVAICFAVGGLFDFLSETKERAPLWMREAGIEWLHRFFEDPAGKWKRIFIEIPVFLSLVLIKKIFSSEAQKYLIGK